MLDAELRAILADVGIAVGEAVAVAIRYHPGSRIFVPNPVIHDVRL
jgi:hypothetical protein